MFPCETARRSTVSVAGPEEEAQVGGHCRESHALALSCRGDPGPLTLSAHTPRPESGAPGRTEAEW